MKLTERQINTIINSDAIDGNRWEKNGKVRIYLDNQSLDDIVDNNPDCDCSYVCGSNGSRRNTVIYVDMVSGTIVATYKGHQEEYVEQRVIDIIDWIIASATTTSDDTITTDDTPDTAPTYDIHTPVDMASQASVDADVASIMAVINHPNTPTSRISNIDDVIVSRINILHRMLDWGGNRGNVYLDNMYRIACRYNDIHAVIDTIVHSCTCPGIDGIIHRIVHNDYADYTYNDYLC